MKTERKFQLLEVIESNELPNLFVRFVSNLTAKGLQIKQIEQIDFTSFVFIVV